MSQGSKEDAEMKLEGAIQFGIVDHSSSNESEEVGFYAQLQKDLKANESEMIDAIS